MNTNTINDSAGLKVGQKSKRAARRAGTKKYLDQIAANILFRATEQGLTLNQVADRAKIPRRALRPLFGRANLTIGQTAKVATALRCAGSDLFAGADA